MIALLTSNQPRHVACAHTLAGQYDSVFVVQEPKSFVLPDSDVMRRYWSRVRAAEHKVFGPLKPLACWSMAVPMGELSRLSADDLRPVLSADRVIVFGSSFITGWLMDALAEKGALNLHIGIAPEYRGAAPNAWALYDGNDHLVGAQVQRLAARLDGGDILAEGRIPAYEDPDPFVRGMLAVRRGIDMLMVLLSHREPWSPIRVNDPAKQIRYSRARDWNESIAAEILKRAGD